MSISITGTLQQMQILLHKAAKGLKGKKPNKTTTKQNPQQTQTFVILMGQTDSRFQPTGFSITILDTCPS